MSKTVLQTAEFTEWLTGLDNVTQARLASRLKKVEAGLMGDVKSLGDDVFEMREHFGPGYRMYYTERKGIMVIMIGGGDKGSQKKDIKKAKKLAKEIEE